MRPEYRDGFYSSGPPEPGPLSRWARMYRAPLLTTALFLTLLVAFGVGNASRETVSEQIPTSPGPNTPAATPQSGCPTVCPLGERCDEDLGACVAVERTPIPCAEGSTYDEEQGYCVPDPTPRPTPPPTRTLPPEQLPPPSPPPEPDPTPEPEPEPTPDNGDEGEEPEPED